MAVDGVWRPSRTRWSARILGWLELEMELLQEVLVEPSGWDSAGRDFGCGVVGDAVGSGGGGGGGKAGDVVAGGV